jgi:hypothetical protein
MGLNSKLGNRTWLTNQFSKNAAEWTVSRGRDRAPLLKIKVGLSQVDAETIAHNINTFGVHPTHQTGFSLAPNPAMRTQRIRE